MRSQPISRAPERALHPSVAQYLGALPHGVHSHPHCLVKGTVLRAIAHALRDDVRVRAGLPAETDQLVEEPPLSNAWIPEVHLNVLFLAICEVRHATRDSFETWAYEGNRAMLAGPLYRVLFGVLGPERIMARIQLRWSAFRRGSTLSPVDMGPQGGTVRLAYAPNLMPDIALRAMRGAFRATADAAGAKQVRINYEQESPTSTLFDVRWMI
jgi:uncharacterized protein (TIGR02265 family)